MGVGASKQRENETSQVAYAWIVNGVECTEEFEDFVMQHSQVSVLKIAEKPLLHRMHRCGEAACVTVIYRRNHMMAKTITLAVNEGFSKDRPRHTQVCGNYL